MNKTRLMFSTIVQYRKSLLAILIILSVSVSVIMSSTGAAVAEPGHDRLDKNDATPADIDIDSLYAAKVAEAPDTNTSYIRGVEPTSTINGHVSWYGPGFHGRRTANGERFDQNEMTAAHKKLPFNTLVRVVDEKTGKAVLVRINDRGPYVRGRVLDLSKEAARRLGIVGRGTTSGRLEIFPEMVVEGIHTVDADGESRTASFITFDSAAQAIIPNGYSVKVGEFKTYSDASDLYAELQAEGIPSLYLTQITTNDEAVYQISAGLFNSERLAGNYLIELMARFKSPIVVEFSEGAIVQSEVTLATAGE